MFMCLGAELCEKRILPGLVKVITYVPSTVLITFSVFDPTDTAKLVASTSAEPEVKVVVAVPPPTLAVTLPAVVKVAVTLTLVAVLKVVPV